VVFAQSGTTSLAELDPDHIALILAVLGERTRMLADRGDIRHVLPFENRGAEMGVTLHHPHGQIYAYPFVPPLQLRALESFEAHAVDTGEALTVTLARRERDAGTRVIASPSFHRSRAIRTKCGLRRPIRRRVSVTSPRLCAATSRAPCPRCCAATTVYGAGRCRI
jgi:hypothetical protein